MRMRRVLLCAVIAIVVTTSVSLLPVTHAAKDATQTLQNLATSATAVAASPGYSLPQMMTPNQKALPVAEQQRAQLASHAASTVGARSSPILAQVQETVKQRDSAAVRTGASDSAGASEHRRRRHHSRRHRRHKHQHHHHRHHRHHRHHTLSHDNSHNDVRFREDLYASNGRGGEEEEEEEEEEELPHRHHRHGHRLSHNQRVMQQWSDWMRFYGVMQKKNPAFLQAYMQTYMKAMEEHKHSSHGSQHEEHAVHHDDEENNNHHVTPLRSNESHKKKTSYKDSMNMFRFASRARQAPAPVTPAAQNIVAPDSTAPPQNFAYGPPIVPGAGGGSPLDKSPGRPSQAFPHFMEQRAAKPANMETPTGRPVPYFPPTAAPPSAPIQMPSGAVNVATRFPRNMEIHTTAQMPQATAGTPQSANPAAVMGSPNMPQMSTPQNYPFGGAFIEVGVHHPSVHRLGRLAAIDPAGRAAVRTPLLKEHFEPFPEL